MNTGEVSDNAEIRECDQLSKNDTSLYSPRKDPMFNSKEVILSKEIEQVFKDFHLYLIGPDGGSRKASGTKQVVHDVRRICRVMNATHSLKDLFHVKTFRDRYVVEHYDNKRPDSVKKYLSCYQNFCDYLVIETINVHGESSSDILHMKLVEASFNGQKARMNHGRFSNVCYSWPG